MIERMVLLTKDNYSVVFNLEYDNPQQKAEKVFRYKNFISDRTYSEFWDEKEDAFNQGLLNPHYRMYSEFDAENTLFLEREVSPYSFYKKRENYRNNAESNTYNGSMAPLFNDIFYGLSSDDVPEYIKNLGFEINYQDEEYDVIYNPANQSYEIKGEYKKTATIDAFNRKITIYRNHYNYPSADRVKLNAVIARYLNEKRVFPDLTVSEFSDTLRSSREKSLFKMYVFEKEKEKNRLLTMHHEIKHLMNAMFFTSINLKNNPTRMSVEDCYKLCVENERSAYLAEIIHSVNDYLKKGDMNDFSMFDHEADWLVNELSQLPSDEERKKYVRHFPNLIKGEFEKFEKNHRADYEGSQFADNLQNMVEFIPLSGTEDFSGELYQKIRRQYFLYEIYNPDNGKTEPISLGQYFDQDDEVRINAEAQNSITIADGRLQKRQEDFKQKVSIGTYDLNLVPIARQMILHNSHQPHFICAEDLLNVSTNNNSDTKANEPSNQAGWSDLLEQYWQKQTGYVKIAKTNHQYLFMINDDMVQYTSPKAVNLSPNSQYETYTKLLAEPTNKNKVINFSQELTDQQALKLYVACVVSGRKMKGSVPTDLSRLDQLADIPAADLQKAKNHINRNNRRQQNTTQQNAAINRHYYSR